MSLTEAIPNIYDVRDILKKCWKEDTAYPESLNNGKKCPSRGQCYVTAILIRELFGGKILTAMIREERHYWNKINEVEVDFTSDQYGGDGYHPIAGLIGVTSKIGTSNKRYKKLRKCWDKHESEAYIWK